MHDKHGVSVAWNRVHTRCSSNSLWVVDHNLCRRCQRQCTLRIESQWNRVNRIDSECPGSEREGRYQSRECKTNRNKGQSLNIHGRGVAKSHTTRAAKQKEGSTQLHGAPSAAKITTTTTTIHHRHRHSHRHNSNNNSPPTQQRKQQQQFTNNDNNSPTGLTRLARHLRRATITTAASATKATTPPESAAAMGVSSMSEVCATGTGGDVGATKEGDTLAVAVALGAHTAFTGWY